MTTTDQTEPLWNTLTVAAATGCAVVGGVFFAFSGFVMPALMRLRGSRGLEAMQSINVTAQRPPLMIALFGTGAVCVALLVRALRHWGDRQSTLLLLGALLYLVGAVVLTAVFHVPINNKVATLSPDDVGQWQDLARRWTWGNHVRTALSVAAAVSLVLAARTGSTRTTSTAAGHPPVAASATMDAWRV